VAFLKKMPPPGIVAFEHRMNAARTYAVACFASDPTSIQKFKRFFDLMKMSDGRHV
jgi:hypothetical protein